MELAPIFDGAGDDVLAAVGSLDEAFSARRFSRVPRSVLPASSSVSRPDMRKRDSMRPRRFSRPSMYFALQQVLGVERRRRKGKYVPFGRIALLLHLGEDAFGLVIDTMATFWHLAVAFDLFLAAHVAGLLWDKNKSGKNRMEEGRTLAIRRRLGSESSKPPSRSPK